MTLPARCMSPAFRSAAIRLLVGLSTLALILSMSCGSDSDDKAAPALSDPNATGVEVANQFVTLLQKKDVQGLQSFLSDAFIIQRADGSSSTKSEYLTKLPEIGQ